MSLGPVMMDLAGFVLDHEERERLRNPQVGGVILFSRNYQNPAQLTELCQQVHALRSPPLVIAVDQEGGRVQRFREGFQSLPAMAQLGDCFDRDPEQAIVTAEIIGWVMASELLAYGVDLSFAPVLDIGNPVSSVIGDRAFHRQPETITRLANGWIRGMREAGMEAVGKHFPGHGSVAADSHHALPFDHRELSQIEALDLVPFRRVIATHLTGIMMAHVIYDRIDQTAAGYSNYWINTVLRQQLGFEGVIFSDDLSMVGAESAGGLPDRARLALEAGCDILLVCNDKDGAADVLDSLEGYSNPTSQMRMIRLHGKATNATELFESVRWQQAIDALNRFNQMAGLLVAGDLFES